MVSTMSDGWKFEQVSVRACRKPRLGLLWTVGWTDTELISLPLILMLPVSNSPPDSESSKTHKSVQLNFCHVMDFFNVYK